LSWNEHIEQVMEQVLIDEQALKDRVAEMARQITEDYTACKAEEVLVIGILRGCVVFLSDLVRRMQLPVNLDFMAVSSYGSSKKSSGIVKINKDLDTNIEDQNVIIVEDILDTGRTLCFLKQEFLKRGPKSVKICTLLDKPERRKADITADYVGYVVPDEFVVGYGLDYNEDYRHFPYIGVLKPEIYGGE